MFRSHYSFKIATTIALTTIAQASWLSAPTLAQTPSSNIYAVTALSAAEDSSGGGYYTTPVAVSNGVIVGNYGSNAYRWSSDGTRTLITSPVANANFTVNDISNGTIVGTIATYTYPEPETHFQGVRIDPDGTVTNLTTHGLTLGTADPDQTYGFSVDNGMTVGYGVGYRMTNRVGVLWNTDGSASYIGYRAGVEFSDLRYTTAVDISDGVVVGYGSKTANYWGYGDINTALRFNTDGTFTDLGKQAGIDSNTSSYATAISHGVTVGYSNTTALRWNADNTVTNLNSLLNLGTNVSAAASDVANGLVVGAASGSQSLYGGNNAILWKADGTYVNLSNFTNNTSSASAIDETTGIIVGSRTLRAANGAQQRQAIMWTPLNNGADGSTSLAVGTGVNTLINRDFTQSAGQTTVNGTLSFDDANTTNGKETFTITGGTVSGAGTITGNLVNTGGTVSPGNSPGTLTVNGNYIQSGTGVLKIEIGSRNSYDIFNILGNGSFGGILDISFIGGYTPSLGNAFNILKVSGITAGAFDTIRITGGNLSQRGLTGTLVPGTGGKGLTFKVAAAVAVPESGTLALIGLAVPVLGVIAARRKNK